MRIVTWNINSVRLRLANLARLAREWDPDVICLQETKTPDGDFPAMGIAALGYPHQIVSGMKSYNGVAIVSRLPLRGGAVLSWCGKEDCRHVVATLPNGLELHSVYVPAGGPDPDPVANPKFAHKLAFLDALAAWCRSRPDPSARRLLVGDLNVAPLETDVWDHKKLLKVVSHTPVEVDRLNHLQRSGSWIDAVREIIPSQERLYTWWSYRAADWAAADRGRRLDHVWISAALRPALQTVDVLRSARGWTLASDHVPVSVSLAE
jgi:exodeoxyribonuclease-3